MLKAMVVAWEVVAMVGAVAAMAADLDLVKDSLRLNLNDTISSSGGQDMSFHFVLIDMIFVAFICTLLCTRRQELIKGFSIRRLDM
jgi:hypothetical protein